MREAERWSPWPDGADRPRQPRTGSIDRHLHDCSWNSGTQGSRQAALETRMQVRHGLGAVTPAQVGMNRSSGSDRADEATSTRGHRSNVP